VNEQEIKVKLSKISVRSTNATVQRKCQKAIAKIRTAQTLIDQAQATLTWAESYTGGAQ
jgi:hypothetical protein